MILLNLLNTGITLQKKIGFDNYHEMSLKLSGQDPVEVTKIFDELDSLTREKFCKSER